MTSQNSPATSRHALSLLVFDFSIGKVDRYFSRKILHMQVLRKSSRHISFLWSPSSCCFHHLCDDAMSCFIFGKYFHSTNAQLQKENWRYHRHNWEFFRIHTIKPRANHRFSFPILCDVHEFVRLHALHITFRSRECWQSASADMVSWLTNNFDRHFFSHSTHSCAAIVKASREKLFPRS